jgi:hypothetical protein
VADPKTTTVPAFIESIADPEASIESLSLDIINCLFTGCNAISRMVDLVEDDTDEDWKVASSPSSTMEALSTATTCAGGFVTTASVYLEKKGCNDVGET